MNGKNWELQYREYHNNWSLYIIYWMNKFTQQNIDEFCKIFPIKDKFKCPLTNSLMREPYTTRYGHVFEKS